MQVETLNSLSFKHTAHSRGAVLLSRRMSSSLEWIYTVLKRFARYICVYVAPGNTYINSAEKGI